MVHLTPREKAILERIALGQTNRQIAVELSIKPETVKWHLKSIFTKFNVRKRSEAARIAFEMGLIQHSFRRRSTPTPWSEERRTKILRQNRERKRGFSQTPE